MQLRSVFTLLSPNAAAPSTFLQPSVALTDLQKLLTGAYYHGDAQAALAPATAVDLPTSIAAANAIQAYLNTHFASGVTSVTLMLVNYHLIADTADNLTTATAVDLASTILSLNNAKAAFNLHIALTTCHAVADVTNGCATVNASDLPTSEALANALVAKITAHTGNGLYPVGKGMTGALNPC